ncbi:sensor histidine kinase [Chitinophaga jiangningensis]|nr:sensor histidine kinase [Chitinophaga jiangningensis]
MKRILVLATANHLYGVSQGKLDRDSAVIFASKMFGLSRLTAYNEGFKSGKDYPGQALIDEGRINEAISRLSTLTGDPQLQLLAELGNYYLHKPGTSPADINMAGDYIKKLEQAVAVTSDKTWQIPSLWLSGELNDANRNTERSKGYYAAATAILRKSGNQRLLALGLFHEAQVLALTDPKRAANFEEAIIISRKLKIPQLQYRITIVQLLDLIRSHPEKFGPTLLAVLDLEKKMGFLHHQYVYSSLSYWSLVQGDLLTSKAYADSSVISAMATKDTVLATLYCMRLCDNVINTGTFEEAMYWNTRALSGPKTRETQFLWYKSLLQRIRILVAHHQYADALSTAEDMVRNNPPDNDFDRMHLIYQLGNINDVLGKKNEAFRYYLQFIDYSSKYPPQQMYTEMLHAYTKIGAFYLERGDRAMARKYAALVINDPIGRVAPPFLAAASHTLFELDSLAGNYVSAIQHYQTYHRFRDSTFSITQRQKMDELTVQYETKKKDQNIELLKRDKQLQVEQLGRSAMVRNITLAGITVLLVVTGLLYNQYRLKQKVNAETEARNKMLQQLVEEKEWLLREVHHRVKNNLQTIVSLLESQSTYLQNEALQAIQESQNRIHAMSLIHQKLYHDENISAVSMATYLPELVEYLSESYNINSRIIFYTKVEDVELDVSQAIPLGLVVNEAVTNAIKYAFPHPEPGNSISITFSMTANRTATLTIADNGVGIDPALLNRKAKGLGLRLIRGLANDIEAQLDMRADHGTKVILTFTVSRTLKATAAHHSTQLV